MIGNKIQRFVESSGKSVQEVAEIIGVSKQNVYQFFERDSIKSDVLLKFSKALNVPVTAFFDEAEISKPRENTGTAGLQVELIDALKDQVATYKLLVHELPGLKQRIEALEKAIKTNKSV